MRRLRRSILPLSSFILALLLATRVAALEVPPAPTQWVTDRAGMLGGTEADLLNRKLADFEQGSGAQFIIYTFESLEGESLEDFTIRCVEAWKVGQKKFDNGLVLFVFEQEKKTRIEVGYGLEGTMTDAFSSRVLREVIEPRFAQGDFAGGLNAGADAIITKIRTGEEPIAPLQPRGQGAGSAQQEEIGIIPVLIILFVVFFVIAPMLGGGRRRRRGGGCNGCIFPFFFFPGGGITFGGGGFSGGGFGGGGFGGGGFSGGGGGFGGGGASGGW
jgi:uncharacterized protein